jgi:hypothetical protein
MKAQSGIFRKIMLSALGTQMLILSDIASLFGKFADIVEYCFTIWMKLLLLG